MRWLGKAWTTRIRSTQQPIERREENSMSAVSPRVTARMELRRSNAARPHRNRARELKRPGKGNRSTWKKALR